VATWSYVADAAPCGDLHPSHVAYDGMSVDLYWETRADPIFVAAGSCLVHTDRRLHSVAMRAGTALARAYTLTYAASAGSARSLLTAVTHWGTSSAVSAAGAVSGGVTQVTRSFTYDADPVPAVKVAIVGDQTLSTAFSGSSVLADLDGDGRADRCVAAQGSTGIATLCALGKGDGTFAAPVSALHTTTAVTVDP